MNLWWGPRTTRYQAQTQPQRGLGAHTSHVGRQPRLCHQAQMKPLDTKALLSLPLGNAPWALSRALFLGEVRAAPDSSGKRQAPCLERPWTLPRAPLPKVDFHLYPSTLINCNHEHNSSQWVLSALLADYWTWEWSWGLLSLQVASEGSLILDTLQYYMNITAKQMNRILEAT